MTGASVVAASDVLPASGPVKLPGGRRDLEWIRYAMGGQRERLTQRGPRRGGGTLGAIPVGLCDPHVHTTFSDGRDSPEDVVDHACRLPGPVLIAVTDHDCVEGALQAAAYAESRDLPVRVIPGEEVSSQDGHVVGLFLSELVAPGMSAEDTIRAIHEQRGLAVAVHPCRSTGVGRLAETLPFDAVEVLNGTPTPRSRAANRRASDLRIAARAVIGGSDAHIKQMLAAAATTFPGASPADFRDAVLGATTRPTSRAPDMIPYLRYACTRLVRRPAALRELWPG